MAERDNTTATYRPPVPLMVVYCLLWAVVLRGMVPALIDGDTTSGFRLVSGMVCLSAVLAIVWLLSLRVDVVPEGLEHVVLGQHRPIRWDQLTGADRKLVVVVARGRDSHPDVNLGPMTRSAELVEQIRARTG